MKKIRRIIIASILGLAIIFGLGFGLYKALVDENSLSINEKKWIDENINNVYSIVIPNDVPIFGSAGEGVFFDFSKYLTDDIDLNINNNTVSYTSSNEGYKFEISSNYENDSLLLFKDHYVLISKNTGLLNNQMDIINLGAGILNTSAAQVKSYYGVGEENFKLYESYSQITEDLGNGNLTYALVPLNEYKEFLISNNINVLYHVSDLNKFYYFKLSDNDVLNSILKKEFNNWKEKYFEDSYNKNNYKLFIDTLSITEAEEDTLTNKVYKYGFVENRPYEILSSGEYGGVTAAYLANFSKFSNVEFTYKKYKSTEELAEAALSNKIDLYYNYYNILTNYIDCGALKSINYYVIADNSIDLSLSNIYGLQYKDVYVLKNSYLYDLLKNLEGINLITYETSGELKKIVNSKNIIVIDEYSYDYYITNLTNNYSVRYRGNIEDSNYTFRYAKDNDTFYKLFSVYTKTIDPQDLLRSGITTYNGVNKKGAIIGAIARNILLFVFVGFVFTYFFRRNRKQIKLNTKVKKEDRLKYIDLLTSLKNRNYYNEKVDVWNKNTIYPQACVVMDINRVKELNDSYGHEEGDKQIQAVANILFKTQIDNSEIIRTDGNEFLVYLVGYSEKQVVSYMKKLVKEFKKLPYDFGVPMGFSMIEDDTKLIEDAFNEASIQMRENKELDEDNEKKD